MFVSVSASAFPRKNCPISKLSANMGRYIVLRWMDLCSEKEPNK